MNDENVIDNWYKIEPASKKSVIEIATFVKDNLTVEVTTCWRHGCFWINLRDDETLTADDETFYLEDYTEYYYDHTYDSCSEEVELLSKSSLTLDEIDTLQAEVEEGWFDDGRSWFEDNGWEEQDIQTLIVNGIVATKQDKGPYDIDV